MTEAMPKGWVQVTTPEGIVMYLNMNLTWAMIPSASEGTMLHSAVAVPVKRVVDGKEVETLETLNQRIRQTPQELFEQMQTES